MSANTPSDPLPESLQSNERVEEFVRLLGQNQRRLVVYLMSLMHNRNDVEDVLQETQLVLWREFQSFELGTNFTAWACRIGYNQMLAWRKRQQRDRLRFSEEFLEAVGEELVGHEEKMDQRLAALSECLGRLSDHHQQLIRYRYTVGDAIDQIASRTGRSVEAVYRMLSRVRHVLHECVTKSVAAGESP